MAQGKALIVGSADWDMDPAISLDGLSRGGAVYPAVDDGRLPDAQGRNTRRKFGGSPHPLATIAYTAAILANATPLAKGKPRYGVAALTMPGGLQRPRRRVQASCPTAAASTRW